jgi:hypothetical protein
VTRSEKTLNLTYLHLEDYVVGRIRYSLLRSRHFSNAPGRLMHSNASCPSLKQRYLGTVCGHLMGKRSKGERVNEVFLREIRLKEKS